MKDKLFWGITISALPLFFVFLVLSTRPNAPVTSFPSAARAKQYSDQGYVAMQQTNYNTLLKEVKYQIEIACKFGTYYTNFMIDDPITDSTVNDLIATLNSLGYKVELFRLRVSDTRCLTISWK